jgi:hypothetical protein
MNRLYTITQGISSLLPFQQVSGLRLYPINTAASAMPRANASFALQSLFSLSKWYPKHPL